MTSETVDGGAAFVFTTPGDVAELRRRVRIIARVHRDQPWPADMTDVIASADDVRSGARLILRSTNVNRSDVVRDQVASRTERLARGDCPLFRTAPASSRDGQLAITR